MDLFRRKNLGRFQSLRQPSGYDTFCIGFCRIECYADHRITVFSSRIEFLTPFIFSDWFMILYFRIFLVWTGYCYVIISKHVVICGIVYVGDRPVFGSLVVRQPLEYSRLSLHFRMSNWLHTGVRKARENIRFRTMQIRYSNIGELHDRSSAILPLYCHHTIQWPRKSHSSSSSHDEKQSIGSVVDRVTRRIKHSSILSTIHQTRAALLKVVT